MEARNSVGLPGGGNVDLSVHAVRYGSQIKEAEKVEPWPTKKVNDPDYKKPWSMGGPPPSIPTIDVPDKSGNLVPTVQNAINLLIKDVEKKTTERLNGLKGYGDRRFSKVWDSLQGQLNEERKHANELHAKNANALGEHVTWAQKKLNDLSNEVVSRADFDSEVASRVALEKKVEEQAVTIAALQEQMADILKTLSGGK
jgi:hypothetical protein